MRLLLPLCVLAVGLAACENSPDVLDTIPDDAESPAAMGPHTGPVPITGATTYTCSGGDTFTVTPIDDGARLDLTRDGASLTLDRTSASMGARYVAGSTEVWISDEGAFVVEDERMVLADCTPATDT